MPRGHQHRSSDLPSTLGRTAGWMVTRATLPRDAGTNGRLGGGASAPAGQSPAITAELVTSTPCVGLTLVALMVALSCQSVSSSCAVCTYASSASDCESRASANARTSGVILDTICVVLDTICASTVRGCSAPSTVSGLPFPASMPAAFGLSFLPSVSACCCPASVCASSAALVLPWGTETVLCGFSAFAG